MAIEKKKQKKKKKKKKEFRNKVSRDKLVIRNLEITLHLYFGL